MSIWSHDYAPELFNNYQDWYDNYVAGIGREPSEESKKMAKDYFFDQTVKSILGIES